MVVTALSSFIGKGKWAGLKVTDVKLNNRSDSQINKIQLSWALALRTDLESPLAQGRTVLFDAAVSGRREKKVESPIIDFTKAAKSLIKNGSLNGEYLMMVGISEVHFSDGWVWTDTSATAGSHKSPRAAPQQLRDSARNTAATFQKARFSPAASAAQMTSCPNTVCVSNSMNGWYDSCDDDYYSGGGLHCRMMYEYGNQYGAPCNMDVCANCPDRDGDGLTTCSGDCDDTNPAMGTNCTATPTPTASASPTGTPAPPPCIDNDGDNWCANRGTIDCNDDPNNGGANINPGKSENCFNSGIDDNCNGMADDQDPDCQEPDGDGDGTPDDIDCAPSDPRRGLYTAEICTDGIDNDCDDLIDGLDGECPSGGGGDYYYYPGYRGCTDYYWVTEWYWCPASQNHVDSNCSYSHTEQAYAGCW